MKSGLRDRNNRGQYMTVRLPEDVSLNEVRSWRPEQFGISIPSATQFKPSQ